jgi:hypothetical protein
MRQRNPIGVKGSALLYRRQRMRAREQVREPPPRPPERSPRERIEAWALTGAPGRVWSFAGDAAAAVPLLLRYWTGRLRSRRGPGEPG